jgi:hypothetical protein
MVILARVTPIFLPRDHRLSTTAVGITLGEKEKEFDRSHDSLTILDENSCLHLRPLETTYL